jgi:hypothetical protein
LSTRAGRATHGVTQGVTQGVTVTRRAVATHHTSIHPAMRRALRCSAPLCGVRIKKGARNNNTGAMQRPASSSPGTHTRDVRLDMDAGRLPEKKQEDRSKMLRAGGKAMREHTLMHVTQTLA